MYIHCPYYWRNLMGGAASKPSQIRGENINLRVSHGQKSLIDRAARALGRNRSDFMLETAWQQGLRKY
jgi:uncharacterized protein (DUF1778 family)